VQLHACKIGIGVGCITFWGTDGVGCFGFLLKLHCTGRCMEFLGFHGMGGIHGLGSVERGT